MKGSLIVIAFFIAGIAVGLSGIYPPQWTDPAILATWTLYVLVAVIGFEFGRRNLMPTLRSVSAASYLLAVFTIIGTLGMTALIGWMLGEWPLTDYLAVGSGMSYYSLSSIIIIDLKSASIGVQLTAQLATLALLTNITRELLALLLGPWLRRWCGPLAPIAAGGVASIDVVLPTVERCSGREYVPVSIVHGVMLEIGVPLLVTLFCTL